MNKMKLLFTVCARAGSKGVKNKNIKNFLGEPLVYYTLSVIDLFIKYKSEEIESIDVAVNTDSKELLQIIDKTNFKYYYVERNPNLALDKSSKVDVIKDTLRVCENDLNKKYDYIIDLDLTSPLRTLENIRELIKVIKRDEKIDVVCSVTNSRRNPYFNMIREEEGRYRKFTQLNINTRQEAPQVYDMNASMYIYRAEFLRQDRSLSVFDGNISVIHMLDTAVLDIDSEEDFELMQVIAPYFYNKYKEYNLIKENIVEL